MSMDDDVVCALTGREPVAQEIALDTPEEDMHPELPIGWLKMEVTRRVINPDWVLLQARIERMRQQTYAQIPEDLSPEDRMAAQDSLDFAVLCTVAALAQTVPKYLFLEDVAYIQNPEVNAEAKAAWADIASALALSTPGVVDEPAK